eukprot:4106881-Prymnesium_polylepis.3
MAGRLRWPPAGQHCRLGPATSTIPTPGAPGSACAAPNTRARCSLLPPTRSEGSGTRRAARESRAGCA